MTRSRALAGPLGAGALYAALVFAAGFALGLIRVLVLADALGEFGAVLVELPVILIIAWFVCGAVIQLTGLGLAARHRLTMGASAFAALMTFEISLSFFIFEAGLDGLLARWSSPAGLAGLLGQILFASLPVLRLALAGRSS